MANIAVARSDNPSLGITFIVVGIFCVSIHDLFIKQLSGDYPLHQIVFVRSLIAIFFSAALIWYEGGIRLLRTDQPGLHLLRGCFMVLANVCYFAGLAAMPLAETVAIFYLAPLFITVLAIPFLGEQVGLRRLGAVIVGFAGVIVMTRPGMEAGSSHISLAAAGFVIASAFCYSGAQILTRKLGAQVRASVLAIYLQLILLFVGAMAGIVAGDGRFAVGVSDPSLQFLLRAWAWPGSDDIWLFAGCGVASGVIGYSLSQAYCQAPAATIAPFEYIALPLALMWGWLVFRDLPDFWTMVGMALIVGAGAYVFLREQIRGRPVASRRSIRKL